MTLGGSEARTRRTVTLAAVSRALAVGMFVPTLAGALDDRGVLLAALVVGVSGLGEGLFQLPAALASDFIGRRRTIALGLVLVAMGSAIGIVTLEPLWILLARTMQGVGVVTSVSVAWVRDVIPSHRTTGAYASVAVGFGLGTVVGLPLGLGLARMFGLQVAFGVATAIAITAMGVTLFTRTDPRPEQLARSAAAPESMGALVPLRRFRWLVLTALFSDAAFMGGFVEASLHSTPLSWGTIGLALPAGMLGLTIAARLADARRFAAGLASMSIAALLAGANLAAGGGVAVLLLMYGVGMSRSILPAGCVLAAPESERGSALTVLGAAWGIGLAAGAVAAGLARFAGGPPGLIVAVFGVLALVCGWLGRRVDLPE